MSVDSETAGILVAVGFLAMGLGTIPVARWFVVALGVAFAVLFRFTPKRLLRPIVGAIIVLIVVVSGGQDVCRNDRKLYRRVQSMSNQLTLPYVAPDRLRVGLLV